jgi:3-deoxy-7-phosphoheptulonate synthase
MSGVERTVSVLRPFKLASREFHPQDTVVPINRRLGGREEIIMMAGPCAWRAAINCWRRRTRERSGAHVLRGGAFKPRSSPYSFQGMGEEGLRIMAESAPDHRSAIITEVMSPEQVPLVTTYADILQIGTRNMQNFALLHAVGESQRPVMLKRGMMSTMEELLMAAEYILSHGNHRVMLCEARIRTFEIYTRNTLDLSACRCSSNSATCPSSWIRATAPASGNWWSRCPAPPSPPGPTASSSKSTASRRSHLRRRPIAQAKRFAALMESLKLIAQAVGRTI